MGVGPTSPWVTQLTRQPRSKSFDCEFAWCSCHWHVGKKSVDHSTSFQYHPHKAVMPHGHTLKQASAETKLRSCSTSIIKFSAGRRVSHLDIKRDSRQRHKALLCRHAGCTAGPLHINCQRSSSYKLDWNNPNRGSISDLCPASAGACRGTVSTGAVSNTHQSNQLKLKCCSHARSVSHECVQTC